MSWVGPKDETNGSRTKQYSKYENPSDTKLLFVDWQDIASNACHPLLLVHIVVFGICANREDSADHTREGGGLGGSEEFRR